MNKSIRCLRAEGASPGLSSKNKKCPAEIISALGQHELLDLLRARRGGELNHVILNQSLSRAQSGENTFDGIDEGKSSSLMSSIEDREDLDFHQTFVRRGSDASVSSSGSSYKGVNIRMTSSSDAPHVSSSFSDQIFTLNNRHSSDSSTTESNSGDNKKVGTSDEVLARNGVRAGGGKSQIAKFPDQYLGYSRSDSGVGVGVGGRANEIHSFFTTGIRSGSQSRLFGGGGEEGGGIRSTGGITSSSGWSKGSESGSRPGENRDQDGNENQLEFFTKGLASMRSGPNINYGDTNRGRVSELTSKPKYVDNKESNITNAKSAKGLYETSPTYSDSTATASMPADDIHNSSSYSSDSIGGGSNIAKLFLAEPSEEQGNSGAANFSNFTDVQFDGSTENEEDDNQKELVLLSSQEQSQQEEIKADIYQPSPLFIPPTPPGRDDTTARKATGNNGSSVDRGNESGGGHDSSGDQKKYSYNDLRRKSIKQPQGKGKSPRQVARESISKQFSKDVVSVFDKREDLLHDSEFVSVFGMSKDEFRALPKWRRQELKKRFQLF